MAQQVNYARHKLDDLSSIPGTHIKMEENRLHLHTVAQILTSLKHNHQQRFEKESSAPKRRAAAKSPLAEGQAGSPPGNVSWSLGFVEWKDGDRPVQNPPYGRSGSDTTGRSLDFFP